MRSAGFAGRAKLIGSAIGLVSVGAPLAVGAPANAATVRVNKGCYVDRLHGRTVRRPNMYLAGSGYSPGAPITISSSNQTVGGQTRANARGEFLAVVPAPVPELNFAKPTFEKASLTVSDGVHTGSTTIRSTFLLAATVPAKAKPHRRVTWYFSGFHTGRAVYGHYLRGKHQVARVRFGRARGACGLLRAKRSLLPAHLRNRKYGVQLDDSKRYSRRANPKIDTTLNVFRF
jgi:hypothetical protein